MNKKKRQRIHRYMMQVLSYYRSEWTDIPDDDKDYRLLVSQELGDLIVSCMEKGVGIQTAAREVKIFLALAGSETNTSSENEDSGTN